MCAVFSHLNFWTILDIIRCHQMMGECDAWSMRFLQLVLKPLFKGKYVRVSFSNCNLTHFYFYQVLLSENMEFMSCHVDNIVMWLQPLFPELVGQTICHHAVSHSQTRTVVTWSLDVPEMESREAFVGSLRRPLGGWIVAEARIAERQLSGPGLQMTPLPFSWGLLHMTHFLQATLRAVH